MQKHTIYCYTNKTNQHKYVGQTNNYLRRLKEHRSAAYNSLASSHNDLIHMKIREYGLENFDVTILEEITTEDKNLVNEREIYWIDKLQTFRGTGLGYNSTKGGFNKEHSYKLTTEQLQSLKGELKNQTLSFKEITEKYNVSGSFVSSINHGVYFKDEGVEYPLRKYYAVNEDYAELIDLLLNSPLPLTDIARQLGLAYSTVKKINVGTMRHGLYPTYPIREKTAYQVRADKIKELLLQGYSNNEIMNYIDTSDETIRRINVGLTFKDDELSYPLRKPVTTIPG